MERNTLKPVLLLDSDILVYRFAFGEQECFHWGDGLYTLHAQLKPAIAKLDEKVELLREKLDAGSVVHCLSDIHANWRRDVLPGYKGHRPGWAGLSSTLVPAPPLPPRPLLFHGLREELAQRHNAVIYSRLEADDVMGVLATGQPNRFIVCSPDKDLLGLPCRLFNWDQPEQGVLNISGTAAARHHLTLTLTGDATDGFKGVPGIGPKRAEDLFSGFEPDEFLDGTVWEQAVVPAYLKAGLTAEDALVQARVAYVLEDYDYTQPRGARGARVRLWTPVGDGEDWV